MGEAERRNKLGLAPRILKPGEQIPVSPETLKNATPIACECGSRHFQPAIMLFSVSALISPIGKELTIQQPVLICLECKKPWNPTDGNKEEEKI